MGKGGLFPFTRRISNYHLRGKKLDLGLRPVEIGGWHWILLIRPREADIDRDGWHLHAVDWTLPPKIRG
ncbi:MAG: hypothetical protein RBG13Loki_3174 [Promethearchaeota archaeon CR_4]|nr:MAG: hypothetical protein RBG13Loki_3174 [Candidatus Lokiarchaeota archaeon CR_4]